ncbi:hypothetical protein HDV63DRAFT_405669 [Trichoderma sp. SZMC 28014]
MPNYKEISRAEEETSMPVAGGPDDKLAEPYRQQGGHNDNDVVDARVPDTGGWIAPESVTEASRETEGYSK